MSASERPFIEIDGLKFVDVLSFFVDRQAKIYGPVFYNLAAGYALDFESEKLGEKIPGDVVSFEQAKDYIKRNLGRYPHGYCALLYGLIKAESSLQGGTGTSTRLATSSVAEKERQDDGGVVSAVSLADAMKKCQEGIRNGRFLPDFGYELVSDEQANCTVYNCHCRDACEASVKEKLVRVGGKPWCALLRYAVADLGLTTGEPFEYELQEFGNLNCKGKIFKV